MHEQYEILILIKSKEQEVQKHFFKCALKKDDCTFDVSAT